MTRPRSRRQRRPTRHSSSATYDAAGNQLSRTDALDRTTSRTYDSLNGLLTVTDPAGVTTTNTYDTNGNQLSSFAPLGDGRTAETGWHHDNPSHPGDVTSITDPNGHVTDYGYDDAGDLTDITDPDGNHTVRGYDTIGQMTSSIIPRGEQPGATPADYTTTYTYDPANRNLTTTDPLGHTTTNTYDLDGSLASTTDAAQHTTAYGYDRDNERTSTQRADATTTTTGYDADGNTISQTDAANHTTTYGYDPLNRLTTTTDPLTRATTSSYDGAGNRLTQTNADSTTVTNTYDQANEAIGVDYSAANTPDVSYTYDPDGRRLTMTDGTGTTTTTYNNLGWITASTNGANATVSYSYDLSGNQTSISDPTGITATNSYDPANRLITLADGLGNTNTFGYDADGHPTTTTDGNNVLATTSYNNAGSSLGVSVTHGTDQLATYAVTRNQLQQVATSSDTIAGNTTTDTYAYTNINQLATANAGPYGYDTADNLTSQPGTSNQTYDAANQLAATTSSGVTTTYTYNTRGDRTGATTNDTATSYGYDEADRLTNANGQTTYAYNGDGLRTAATTAGQTSQFTYDTSTTTPRILADGTNSYLYGPDGTVAEQIDATTQHVTYLQHDQLGSTRLLTDNTANVVGAYTYTPYGQRNTVTDVTQTTIAPIGYAGAYTDANTGLIYLINRHYDPQTAQFLTRDPAEALTHVPYMYANDDPLDEADPSGLWPGEGLWHYALDVVAVPVYATYYVSYQAGKAVNAVGCAFGEIGCTVSHAVVATSPIPWYEASGLAGDAALDWLKNKTTGNGESIYDEDVCGGILPRFVDSGGPKAWLPGLSKNPDGSVHIDFEW